jgi:hypothetical protein
MHALLFFSTRFNGLSWSLYASEALSQVAGFMMHPKKGGSVKKGEKISLCPHSTRWCVFGVNMMLFLGMGSWLQIPTFCHARTRSSGRHHNADHQQNAMRLSPQGGDRGPSREQPEPLKQAGAPGNEGEGYVFQAMVFRMIGINCIWNHGVCDSSQ